MRVICKGEKGFERGREGEGRQTQGDEGESKRKTGRGLRMIMQGKGEEEREIKRV